MNSKINPTIPLAYNIADGSKKYVLFCGAGVSKDANVPTGWDILLKTLRIIRTQEEGENNDYSNEEMENYYHERYEDIGYSDIISSIFPSNEEQRDYLVKFFNGKSPGRAHQLIAELVKGGFIRIIVTTNFDSLIEYALDEAGLRGNYSIISNGEDVLTSKPWHNEEVCRIYKLHGTIEQGKIRNTKKDLEKLEMALEKDFMDLAEKHGLIVLGYDGRDKAVMHCLNNRRFKGYTLFWCSYKGQCNKDVESLINKQDGRFINIEGASEFLEEILSRIEIAKRGIEQSDRAVAQVRVKNIATSKSADIEIQQAIDDQKRKLRKYIASTLDELDPNDYESLWEGLVKIYNYSMECLIFSEQIMKYRDKYWLQISTIFEEIHALNKSGDRYGKDGVINYFFFIFLELFGAILLENGKYDLLRKLLEIKKLNINKDGIENILEWNTRAQFIETKKENDTSKWIVSHMHYLLQIVESQENPFDFDLKNRVLEADLIFYVYSVKNPIDSYFPYWVPRAVVYCRYGSPDLFKKIKFDNEFGEIIAHNIFSIKYEELIILIKQAKDIYTSDNRFQRMRFNSTSDIFREF